MFRRGKIAIQIKRFSFARKIVEFSPCNRLLNFLVGVFLKRHRFEWIFSLALAGTLRGSQPNIGSDSDHVRIRMSPKVASDNSSHHGVEFLARWLPFLRGRP